MNPVRRHIVYFYLLSECLSLMGAHHKDLEVIYGEAPDLVRSLPSTVARLIIQPAIAKMFDFDLRGVPGFFYGRNLNQYAWCVNFPEHVGLVRPYYQDNLISGLFIYSHARDIKPRLFSSKGLLLGTEAIQPSGQNRDITE